MNTRVMAVVMRSGSWRRLGLLAAGVAWFATVATATGGSRPDGQTAAPSTGHAALVAHGDYLTHKVAMCVECHSPRDERGNIITAEEFMGAPVLVNAPYWRPDWATREPNIAGLRGFTDDQVIALLMNGRATDRDPPKRPMPPFRMTREDAEAVVAYLRTK
jgi:mono/diheme cytochrome c family protein